MPFDRSGDLEEMLSPEVFGHSVIATPPGGSPLPPFNAAFRRNHEVVGEMAQFDTTAPALLCRSVDMPDGIERGWRLDVSQEGSFDVRRVLPKDKQLTRLILEDV